jgi:hypothetical protein
VYTVYSTGWDHLDHSGTSRKITGRPPPYGVHRFEVSSTLFIRAKYCSKNTHFGQKLIKSIHYGRCATYDCYNHCMRCLQLRCHRCSRLGWMVGRNFYCIFNAQFPKKVEIVGKTLTFLIPFTTLITQLKRRGPWPSGRVGLTGI